MVDQLCQYNGFGREVSLISECNMWKLLLEHMELLMEVLMEYFPSPDSEKFLSYSVGMMSNFFKVLLKKGICP